MAAGVVLAEVAGWIAVVIGAALAGGGARAWLRERRFLLAALREVVPSGAIRERDELARLRAWLSGRIRWHPERVHDARPPLRASAARVLASGEGFCGENARVAVRLLRLGGVRAHRLYLEGERWGHVVVEHRWDGGWCLFDAHADPRTELTSAEVGRIRTDDLRAFPNRVSENPWRSAYRIPGLRRLPGGIGRRLRPPAWITLLAETPALVVATAGALLALAGVAALIAG